MYENTQYTNISGIKKAKQTCLVEHPIFFIYTKYTAILLQRDETGRMCGSNTRATVLDWLVGDGELTQVVTAHLRLWGGQTALLVTTEMPYIGEHEHCTVEGSILLKFDNTSSCTA